MRNFVSRIELRRLLEEVESLLISAQADQRAREPNLRLFEFRVVSHRPREMLRGLLELRSVPTDLAELVLGLGILRSDGELLLEFMLRFIHRLRILRPQERDLSNPEMDTG